LNVVIFQWCDCDCVAFTDCKHLSFSLPLVAAHPDNAPG
jgi:hypothetical protein